MKNLNLKLMLSISVLFTVFVTPFILIVNNGFYFSEFKEYYEVELFGGSKESMETAVGRIPSLPNIVLFDQSRGNVPIFQNIGEEDLVSKYQELISDLADAPSFHVRKFFPDVNSVSLNNVLVFLILFPITSIFAFFLVYILKNNKVTNFYTFAKFSVFLILSMYFTTLLVLLAMSISSRIIMIRDIHLIALFISNIVVMVLFLNNIKKELSDDSSLSDLTNLMIDVTSNLKQKLALIVFIIFVTIVALGQAFVWVGLFVLYGTIAAIFSLITVSTLFKFDYINFINNYLPVHKVGININKKISTNVANDEVITEVKKQRNKKNKNRPKKKYLSTRN